MEGLENFESRGETVLRAVRAGVLRCVGWGVVVVEVGALLVLV